ncbi:MAG: hypothetical protein IKX68_09390 [Clostridiales bacterium]|nr:hypothetical protein [Clostridiales bacterium]
MKRLIAVLLSASMVLALAGCGKKDEKETKKTKKTKATEVTEETEDPFETESESESESESDTQTESDTDPSISSGDGHRIATPKDYPISPDFVISHDAENVYYSRVSHLSAYGEPYDNNGRTMACLMFKEIDSIRFEAEEQDTYSQLWNTLEAMFGQLDINYDELYEKLLPQFCDNIAQGKAKDYTMKEKLTFFRADTEYFSFMIKQDYDCDMENASIKTYNYATSDGREISFNDIVTDKQGFSDFFIEYISNGDYYDFEIRQARDLAGNMLVDDEFAFPVEFLLGYDGIYFVYSENNVYPTIFKIPAMYCADYIDMSYFGKTPETYTLSNDGYGRITWDIYEDGVLEEIHPEFITDEYDSIVGIDLVMDDLMRVSVPDADLVEGDQFMGMKLVKGNNTYYAYITMALEEDACNNYVFELTGSAGFEYVGKFTGSFTDTWYDPVQFVLTQYSEVFGTGIAGRDFSGVKTAIPEPISDYYYKDAVVVAAKDIPCKDQSGDDYTIPAGTVVLLFGYEADGNELEAMTLNKDATKNKLVSIDYAIDGYTVLINGENQDDVFDGIRYAG